MTNLYRVCAITHTHAHARAHIFMYIYIYTHTRIRKNNASKLLCVFYALTDDDVTFIVLLHVSSYQTVLTGSFYL